MTDVRVCFPTTESVVFVDRITALPSELVSESGMCRTGTAAQEAASRGYHAFVRSPTGCIHRLFGHDRFRMDVSGRTDSGPSWELAVLMAHAAQAAGRLAGPEGAGPDRGGPGAGAAAGVLLCATGAVGPLDLGVGEVGHVGQKVALARPVLAAARAQGLRVVLAVPPGNAADLPPAERQALAAAGVEIVTPASAHDLAAAAGLPLPRLAEAASRTWRPGTNPYRGLAAFGAEDRGLFFGRGRAREEVLQRLRLAAQEGRPFVLIHGRSGIGKSSLLRAGLAGDVVERQPPPKAGQSWRVVTLALRAPDTGGPPHRQILAALGAEAAPDPAPDADDPAVTPAAPGAGDPVLLLLDQLEQGLIGLPAPQAEALGALLQALVAGGRVWVIGTIRSDQLDRLDAVPGLAALARDERLYRLEPPTPFELGEMIGRPAAQAGLSFLPGPHGQTLPDLLVQEALRAPGGIPFLQVMLMRLAASADDRGRVRFEAYDELGGIARAVRNLAEDALAALPAALRRDDLLDRALSALIRIEGERPDTGTATGAATGTATGVGDGARVLARSFDTSAAPPGSELRRLLAHLHECRILESEPAIPGQGAGRTPATPAPAPVYRLAHESLIAGWPRLAEVAGRLHEDLILRDWLDTAARDWERANRDPGLLAASPARLSRARHAVTAARLAFPPQALLYLETAERNLNRQTRARQNFRRAIWAASALVAIAVIAFAARLAAVNTELAGTVVARDAALTEAETARARAEAATRVAEDRAESEAQAVQRLERALSLAIAPAHATEGWVDSALLTVLDAAEPYDRDTIPTTVLTTFDRVLQRAVTETRYALPPMTRAFTAYQAMWLHDPDSGTLWRVDPETGPVPLATIAGQAEAIGTFEWGLFGQYLVVAVVADGAIRFVTLTEQGEVRVLAERRLPEPTHEPDGTDQLRLPLPVVLAPNGYAAYPEGEGTVVVNLRTGHSVALPVVERFRLDPGGRLYLTATPDHLDAQLAAELGAIGLPPRADRNAHGVTDALRYCFRDAQRDPETPRLLRYLSAQMQSDQGHFPLDPVMFLQDPLALCLRTGRQVILSRPQENGHAVVEIPYSVELDPRYPEDDVDEPPRATSHWASMGAPLPSHARGDWIDDPHSLGLLAIGDFRTLSLFDLPDLRPRQAPRVMDAAILALSALSADVVAMLLDRRDHQGLRAGRDLVVVRPYALHDVAPFGGVLIDRIGTGEPSGALAELRRRFDAAPVISPAFDLLGYGIDGTSRATPDGTVSLHVASQRSTELRFSAPSGDRLWQIHVPRGYDDGADTAGQPDEPGGQIVVAPDFHRAVWFAGRRVLVVDKDGDNHPELRLPSPAWQVRFLGRGPDLLVIDRGSTVTLWTPTPDGWQSRTLFTATGRINAIESDPAGRWLLATIDDPSGDRVHVRLIDLIQGDAFRTLTAGFRLDVAARFLDPNSIAVLNGSEVRIFQVPDLDLYRGLALELLRQGCRPSAGNGWRQSPCWVSQGR